MINKNRWLVIIFVTLLLALFFSTQVASSSVNITASYDPQVDCLGVKMMVPPLVVFERIRPNMDMEDASKIISLFAKQEDQITVSLGEGGENNHIIVWKWFTAYDETRKTGETAILKVTILNFKVTMVSLDQVILTDEKVEHRSREKSTFQFIMDRDNKK